LSVGHEVSEFCDALGLSFIFLPFFHNDTPGLLKQYKEKMEHSEVYFVAITLALGKKVTNGVVGRRET
jgi:hypothetical protein